MKKQLFLVLLGLLPCLLFAQPFSAPLHSPAEQIAERWLILRQANSAIHPELKGFSGKDLAQLADSLSHAGTRLDLMDRNYVANQFNEWSQDRFFTKKPLLRHFFKTPAHFFELTKYGKDSKSHPVLSLRLNPVLHVKAGADRLQEDPIYQNLRGVELRAVIDEKVFFYTHFVEYQANFPEYVNRWTNQYRAVPGAGWYKSFQSQFIDQLSGRDVNIANASVGFMATKHIGIQLGHGTHFIGNGYRSMFLSGFAPPGLFLQFDTRIWKFQYRNLFLELSPTTANSGVQGLLPKKYAALHYLNYQVNPRLAFGLFEGTVFHRSSQFELQYLNPAILYRSIEGNLGSPDNVLIGMDGRWNVVKGVQVYGQLLLDEFKMSELLARDGWWANKYAIQAGAKYLNAFGVDHLDVQVEWNSARPYTWSHNDSLNSFTHFNHPLAHPLGANFKELIGIIRWQPAPNWNLTGRYLHLVGGDDPNGKNFGTNPLRSYRNRVQEYGNYIGQGIASTTQLLGFDLSWQFYRNTYLDFSVLLRNKKSDSTVLSLESQLISGGLRMNIWTPNNDF